MESIGAQISPVRASEDVNGKSGTFLTDLTPMAPKTQRFKTPSARDTIDDPLLTGNGLKYLQSGKMEKETIKDYISTTRLMLRKGLTNEARKRDLSQVTEKYKSEVKDLKKAQQAFEEDH